LELWTKWVKTISADIQSLELITSGSLWSLWLVPPPRWLSG